MRLGIFILLVSCMVGCGDSAPMSNPKASGTGPNLPEAQISGGAAAQKSTTPVKN
jgi:hypothetical protein